MASRLTADGHAVTVLTTDARQASDFWHRPPLDPPRPPTQEVLDGVVVQRLPISYPRPAPYAFGLLRRMGLWLHLSRLPATLVRPVQRNLSRWMPPLTGLRAALEMRAPQVDLIHADDSSWDSLLVAAADSAQRYSKPLVLRPLMHLGDAWTRAHYQMAHQVLIYQKAAAVIALSQLEAQAFTVLGVPPERVHTISMGVGFSPPTPLDGLDTQAFRQEQGLGDRVVAFLGANTFDKGAFTLAKAVLQLNRAGLAVDLVCAGPQGEGLAAFLEQQPPEERVPAQQRVHILGIVDEVTKHCLLQACDLLALPSQVDTFGIVFLEAWLHSKPVIGARAGGIPEVVEHERNGLLVPFNDVNALAAAIRRLLTEPGLAARLGAAGHRELQQYTWDRTYRDVCRIYGEAISRSAGGA